MSSPLQKTPPRPRDPIEEVLAQTVAAIDRALGPNYAAKNPGLVSTIAATALRLSGENGGTL